MRNRFGRLLKAVLGFGLLLCWALFAHAGPQQSTSIAATSDINSPGSDFASSALPDSLINAFLDTRLLTRVQTLEYLDNSVVFDEPVIVSLLRDSLYDADPLVADAALRALTRRDNEQERVLSEVDLSHFEGPGADLAKVHFAAMNQDTGALRGLIRNADTAVQEGAFEALAAIDARAAIEALRSELSDKASLYRLQTLQLLIRSPFTNSSDILLPALRATVNDEDPLVRDYAQRALQDALPKPDAAEHQSPQ